MRLPAIASILALHAPLAIIPAHIPAHAQGSTPPTPPAATSTKPVKASPPANAADTGKSSSSATASAGENKTAPKYDIAGLDWVRLRFSTFFNREPFGWTRAQVLRRMSIAFDMTAIGGNDHITDGDHAIVQQIEIARSRGRQIGAALASDINGDMKITRDEARRALQRRYASTTLRREARIQRAFDQIFRADANRDGVVTLQELGKAADMRLALRSPYRRYGYGARSMVPMTLDLDKDQKVSRKEYEGAVLQVFKDIDADNDGALSDNEMRTFMASLRDVRRRDRLRRRNTYRSARYTRQVMRCQFPEISKGADIIYLGAYSGRGLAAVTMAGATNPLTVAQVNIAKLADGKTAGDKTAGDKSGKPLVLLLANSSHMIWQLTGDTDRVAQVIVSTSRRLGGKATTGVAGVPKDKVHFLPGSQCLPQTLRSKEDRDQVANVLKTRLGVKPAILATMPSLAVAQLPAGNLSRIGRNPKAIATPQDTPAAFLWQAMNRRYPGGLVRLDPAKIVAETKVSNGNVLPGRAGLAQLIDQGAIELKAPPAVAGRAPLRPSLRTHELRIVAPLTLPPALRRYDVRKLVIAKGVPAPKGLDGRICVVAEETGAPVKGSGICR